MKVNQDRNKARMCREGNLIGFQKPGLQVNSFTTEDPVAKKKGIDKKGIDKSGKNAKVGSTWTLHNH